MFIKEVFSGEKPLELHDAFLKFSRGEFRGKYITEIKKQKDRFVIKTSSEFANYLVKKCLEESSELVKVSGAIISTLDLRNEIKFPILGVKQFMGIKQVQVNAEVKKGEIIELMNKFPKVFFALSFIAKESELKIKPKAPKSAKPSTSTDKAPAADFCSLKTSNIQIVKDLFFDISEFKEAKISHTIKINEILYPKNEKDPIKVRENSKRKGQIIRISEVDGKATERSANFEG